MTDFDQFWAAYPHKVGKNACERKYGILLKKAKHPDLLHQEILAGLERYKETKPEWRSWCNPLTFLNQGRWQDEPAEVKQLTGETAPPTRPQYLNGKPPPRLDSEERRKRQLRSEVMDDMRREGLNPWLAPLNEIKRRMAERSQSEEDSSDARRA